MLQDVIQMPDHGFMMVGTTGSTGTEGNSIYLLKVDSFGKFQTQRTYGYSTNDEWATNVFMTQDTLLVISGYTNSIGAGGYDGYVIKTKRNGDTLWSRTYGWSDWDFIHDGVETYDGNYVFAGETYSSSKGKNDLYYFKTNRNGAPLWIKRYGTDSAETINSIIETSDSNLVMCGYTQDGNRAKDILVIKTDPNGDTLWEKRYGGSQNDIATSLLEAKDGNIVIAGVTASMGFGGYDFYLMKLNQNGDSIWAYNFGGTKDDFCNKVLETPKGEFFLGGWSKSFFAPVQDAVWYHTNGNGNYMSSGNAVFSQGNEQAFNAGDVCYDGSFVFGGISKALGNGLEDYYLVKADTVGLSVANSKYMVSIDEPQINGLQVYPNPTKSSINISTQEMLSQIKLFDCTGRLISVINTSANNQIINLEMLHKGIYLLQITNVSQQTEVIRIIKQ